MAIIAVPTVFVAVLIASLFYCYYKRKSRQIYDIKTAVQSVSKNSVEIYLESSV